MQYSDVLFFVLLSTLTIMSPELARRAGIFFQQGRKERATMLIVAAGVGQAAAVLLALHLGFRASLV